MGGAQGPGRLAAPVKEAAETQAKEGTGLIFEAIEASNFYGEFGKGANPDLAIGTVATWIDSGRPGRPIQCQSIPIRELEINIDAEGCIDDRFVSRWVRPRYLQRIFPNEQLPAKIIEAGKARVGERAHQRHLGLLALLRRSTRKKPGCMRRASTTT